MFHNQRFKILLSNRQNLYMTLRNSDLFHNVCNVKKKKKSKIKLLPFLGLTTFPWFFQPNLIPIKKWFKKFFNDFVNFIINHGFYVITIWMYYMLFISVLRTNKVNWIFYLSEFLRLFMIHFKYGLILSRYFLINRVLFLS